MTRKGAELGRILFVFYAFVTVREVLLSLVRSRPDGTVRDPLLPQRYRRYSTASVSIDSRGRIHFCMVLFVANVASLASTTLGRQNCIM